MATKSHVVLGGMTFRVDESAQVPFRRVSESVMVPRTNISGSPGAINLERDVWLWALTDFIGGEGRQVFDSQNPLGPPAFFKSDGGIDVRTRGEFSMHPDEEFVPNTLGGGSAPTTVRTLGSNLTTLAGSPATVSGKANLIRLSANDAVSTNHTPGAGTVIVHARLVNTQATKSNKKCDVRFRVVRTSDSNVMVTKTVSLRDNEKATPKIKYSAAAATQYRYEVANTDSTPLKVDVAFVESAYTSTGTPAPNNVLDMRMGFNEDIWAVAWDGTNSSVLKWDFTNNVWLLTHANIVGSKVVAMATSDQYQYAIFQNSEVWKWDGSANTKYASAPTTSGVGLPLGIAVSNNRLYTLFQQGLFELYVDETSGLPLAESSATGTNKYKSAPILGSPTGQFYKESSPSQTYRQRMSAVPTGVRFFVNLRGESAVIYEYSSGVLLPIHFLPSGYKVTSMKHYAGLTFIGATFTNRAASPADTRAAIFFITADATLRFLGYLRFTESNQQDVSYIASYAHDAFFLQGRRVWRYNLGTGGITLENEISAADETTARSMVRMDKKFWVAYEDSATGDDGGVWVAKDAYPKDTTMWLYSPIWDADLPDLDKVLLSIEVVTKPLPANTSVEIQYSVNEGDYVSAGTVSTAASVRTRLSISSSSSTVKPRTLQWRCGLTSSDGVDTPTVRSVTARLYVLDYEDSFEMTLLFEDDTPSDRIVGQQLSGRQKAQNLWTLKTNKTIAAFLDRYSTSTKAPAQDSYDVLVEDPLEELGKVGQGSGTVRLKVIT